jgi:hypothetical protein
MISIPDGPLIPLILNHFPTHPQYPDSHACVCCFCYPGDLLVHAGDMTHFGKMEDLLDFDSFLGDLPHPNKIVIPGNHDVMFQDAQFVKRFQMKNATVLLDSSVVVDGFKVYGSSWQPQWTGTGYFMPPGGAIESKWKRIPLDTDILVTRTHA